MMNHGEGWMAGTWGFWLLVVAVAVVLLVLAFVKWSGK